MIRLLVFCLALANCALQAHAGSFPRDVTHRLGVTRIPAAPERIVTIGYHEQDFLYALGIAPVGVHEWFGNKPYASWVWADGPRAALGGRPAVQYGYEVDIEWVYAQKPDLIIASFYNLSPSLYHALSQIAPVVTGPAGEGVWSVPWQDELRLIARATATEDRAEAVITRIERQIARIAAAHPEFRGREVTTGYYASDHFVGYDGHSGANALLAQLGFRQPPIFNQLAGANGQFSVSRERIDLFDRAAVLWLVDPQTAGAIRHMPLYKATRLARQGRSIWADPDLAAALSFMTPLSIPYALERLEPLLRHALANSEG
ncbi:iron complex transport system substrate-binding protein [Thioclava dalianensis]|uniref:ABC transporter substrate-binding protein n=1 Tax=Thioclava dalianensis TaxID=1185766 RepID=UPI00056FE671|nr:ABC transporter substrate-binding protein [Thioclava dalianensis]SFN80797.1 iron complex transport system substrate-binding protein [Thioclava dalianensis]